MRCHYNAVIFLPNPPQRHPIARPLGQGMRCLLWIQTVLYILPLSVQWCLQYYVILDHVITALHCIEMAPRASGGMVWTYFAQNILLREFSLYWNKAKWNVTLCCLQYMSFINIYHHIYFMWNTHFANYIQVILYEVKKYLICHGLEFGMNSTILPE